jgi:hypothetical protein
VTHNCRFCSNAVRSDSWCRCNDASFCRASRLSMRCKHPFVCQKHLLTSRGTVRTYMLINQQVQHRTPFIKVRQSARAHDTTRFGSKLFSDGMTCYCTFFIREVAPQQTLSCSYKLQQSTQSCLPTLSEPEHPSAHSPSPLGCCSCRGSGSCLRCIGCCCCDAEYSSGVNRRRWVGAVKSLPPDSRALCEGH